MQSTALTVEKYIEEIELTKKEAFIQLRNIIKTNIPLGFEERMIYGMLGYVVPHSLYPKGYHCDPTLPLSFISIAAQKNYLAFYHMGLYAEGNLLQWFQQEYKKTPYKLDMGKCCVRFKKMDSIPYQLIGELVNKVSPQEWIQIYEANIKQGK